MIIPHAGTQPSGELREMSHPTNITHPTAERLITNTLQTIVRFLSENPQASIMVKIYTDSEIKAFLKPFDNMQNDMRYQAVVRFPWDLCHESMNRITRPFGVTFQAQKAFGGGRKYILEVRSQSFRMGA